jgi:DTW domain-containing protein YfiP
MPAPFPEPIILTHEQWQEARRMWRKGNDTHDIARAMGCTEAHVYNGLYLLKQCGSRVAA